MAEGLFVGAAVGAAVAQAYTDLYNVAKDAVSKMVWCKKYCGELAQDLRNHLPAFREICIHVQTPAREWEQPLLDFKEKLEQGRLLVESCMQLSGWHPIQRLRYTKSILKLRQQILQHLQTLAPFNTLLLQQLHAYQPVLLERQEKLQEAIDPLLNMIMSLDLRSDQNTARILDWVRQANTGDSAVATEVQHVPQGQQLVDELQVPQFVVGLDSHLREVKSLLFSSEEKVVAILGGMGGIGKTTLALAVCKDPEVRDFFQDQIHFVTVSQSPNILGLLSTIWQQVVGNMWPVPLFQNEEDAYRQLQGRLLSTCTSNHLLVLDDVWSKATLEKLSFDVRRCRTLITTRQASILKTHNSKSYELGLLSAENAQRVFCYWAFGQECVPQWAEETLVQEVILECKGLPLALKVIGGSLSSAVRMPMAWRNARDKLRQAEPLDDYHKDALQKRLQTSIDILDPTLRECFLDLGAYPEDSRCSVDTLLDIWVYVRGMEWVDAVLALTELSSRCLLDLESGSSDVPQLEYGIARQSTFSQHDVMRDLALYLGRDNHPPPERTRLLMPQREEYLPRNWQSTAPLAAQIISINTGSMAEQDWPTLAFPFAEALLLYTDGDAYHLPPFVQSMCELKVLFIRSSKPLQSIGGSLEGLNHLKSIDMQNLVLIPDTTRGLGKLRLQGCAGGMLCALEGRNLPSLDVVGLSSIQLSELPESCCELRSLQVLDLCSCRSLCKLPEELGNLNNLLCLFLVSCKQLKGLPPSLCKLQRLEVLHITSCSGLEELPQNLGQLGALKELSLFFCSRLRNLPESFGNLGNLKMLELWKCKELRHLPSNFGQLISLKELDLRECRKLKHLPESFGQLSELRILDLGGVELESMPASVGVGLVALESVHCHESLVPLWRAVRGDLAPHPQTY